MPTAQHLVVIGVFVDSAVAGLRYKTKSGLSGITNESGEFEYREGDNVTFSLGSIDLGTTNAASTLTPVEIVGAEDTSDPKVINVARFLQTLDDDNDPSNGLKITEAVEKEFDGKKLEFDQPVSSFEIAASTTIQSATGRALVDATKALNHLHGSLGAHSKATLIAQTDEIQDQVPAFVPDDSLEREISIEPQYCEFNGELLSHGESRLAFKEQSIHWVSSECSV